MPDPIEISLRIRGAKDSQEDLQETGEAVDKMADKVEEAARSTGRLRDQFQQFGKALKVGATLIGLSVVMNRIGVVLLLVNRAVAALVIGLGTLVAGIGAAIIAFGALHLAFGGLLAVLGAVSVAFIAVAKSIPQAADQQDAINRLVIAFESLGASSLEASRDMQDFADSLQATSKFSDQAILRTSALLAQLGRLSGTELKEATQATLDLAVGLGRELPVAALIMAKAAQGSTFELRKYGLVIDRNIPKTQRWAAALEFVQQRFGGAAQRELRTFSASMQQLGNSFQDIAELAGGPFLQFLQRNAQSLTILNNAFVSLAKQTGLFKGLFDLPSTDLLEMIERVQRAEERSRLSFIGTLKSATALSAGFRRLADRVSIFAKAMREGTKDGKDLLSVVRGIFSTRPGGLERQELSQAIGAAALQDLATVQREIQDLTKSESRIKVNISDAEEALEKARARYNEIRTLVNSELKVKIADDDVKALQEEALKLKKDISELRERISSLRGALLDVTDTKREFEEKFGKRLSNDLKEGQSILERMDFTIAEIARSRAIKFNLLTDPEVSELADILNNLFEDQPLRAKKAMDKIASEVRFTELEKKAQAFWDNIDLRLNLAEAEIDPAEGLRIAESIQKEVRKHILEIKAKLGINDAQFFILAKTAQRNIERVFGPDRVESITLNLLDREFSDKVDKARLQLVSLQRETGVEIFTDEQRRRSDNFVEAIKRASVEMRKLLNLRPTSSDDIQAVSDKQIQGIKVLLSLLSQLYPESKKAQESLQQFGTTTLPNFGREANLAADAAYELQKATEIKSKIDLFLSLKKVREARAELARLQLEVLKFPSNIELKVDLKDARIAIETATGDLYGFRESASQAFTGAWQQITSLPFDAITSLIADPFAAALTGVKNIGDQIVNAVKRMVARIVAALLTIGLASAILPGGVAGALFNQVFGLGFKVTDATEKANKSVDELTRKVQKSQTQISRLSASGFSSAIQLELAPPVSFLRPRFGVSQQQQPVNFNIQTYDSNDLLKSVESGPLGRALADALGA